MRLTTHQRPLLQPRLALTAPFGHGATILIAVFAGLGRKTSPRFGFSGWPTCWTEWPTATAMTSVDDALDDFIRRRTSSRTRCSASRVLA